MSRLSLPLLLALALLGGGYALLRPAQAEADAPLALWIATRDGENLLQAAPADALEAVRTLARLPEGAIVDAALAPGGEYLAFARAEEWGETLWLLSLPGGDLRRVEQAAGFGRLRWGAEGLAYAVYPRQGAPSTRLLPLAAGGARKASLRLVPLEDGRARLSLLDLRSGEAQTLTTLPPARWRLLGWEGAWAAAERYPHGVQVISLETGNFRALGGARRFVGFLPSQGNGSSPKGGRFLPAGNGGLPGGGSPSRPVSQKSDTTATLTVVPSETPTLMPTKTPAPTATPTASPTPPCASVPDGCPEERVYGYQPFRWQMGAFFVQAAENTLGSAAPVYDGIFTGRPPVRQTVSPQRPLPQVTLRGIAWQESAWLQFLSEAAPFDGVNACTIVSFDCGYGLMQVTSCMGGGCGWLEPDRAAAELPYNLGAGTNILIQKWNSVPYIGDNDPTDPALWYYAVLAYNGYSVLNDPNNLDRFDPLRPPFREGSGSYRYPYQERVYGWMAHPPHVSGTALWRPTGIPPVPRGIFGLRSPDSWTPPSETSRPVTYLLHDVRWPDALSPTLTVRNTQPYTLALDVLFYDADGSFNRRYLPPSTQEPWFVEPYLRVAPSGTFTLPLQNVFFTETFTGFLRVYASEGLSITLEAAAPEKAQRAYLPLVVNGGALTNTLRAAATVTCTQVLTNGGFETFSDGRPRGWQGASAGGYVLADSTWFWRGHFGGYLGGYDGAADTLSQTFSVPTGTLTATLTLAWDVLSEEPPDAAVSDVLTVTLVDAAGLPLGAPLRLSNVDAAGGWAHSAVTWPLTGTLPAGLVLQTRTDEARPTAFFVDEMKLEMCGLGP